jgi:Brp/Blh family beta-carotene 15,15'-monooxygenase
MLDAARRVGTAGTAAAVLALGSGDVGWQAALALTLFVTLGLPHGALDHRVGGQALGWGTIPFHLGYVAAGLAFAALWFVVPALGAAAFLALSAWHFGEAEVRDLPVRTASRPALALARGAMVVALLAASWPAEVAALLGAWSPVPADLPRTIALPVVAWGTNVALTAAAAERGAWPAVGRAALDAGIVAAWLWTAEPLLAFAGYFTAWHSLDHLRVLGVRLRLAPTALAAAVVPYTALAAAGGALIAALGFSVGGAPFAAAALGAIAAVATPHVALVEVWRATFAREATPARG